MENYSVEKLFIWTCPLDTWRTLNVHKTFRKRPGHLLNVLCSLKLHPVSKGILHRDISRSAFVRCCHFPIEETFSYFSLKISIIAKIALT